MKYTIADDLTYNKPKKATLHGFHQKVPFCSAKWQIRDFWKKNFPLAQKGYIFGGGVYKWSFTALQYLRPDFDR